MHRLVTSGLQFFDAAVRQRVATFDLSNEEKDSLVYQKAGGYTELVARIGINAGAVIAQEGDYFGRTVNVAARIADFAQPHEVIVSDEAKQSASVTDVDFELIGDVPLKGVSRPVRLHRATRSTT